MKQYFWWPTLDADTWAYVSTCTVCAHDKTFHQPSGLHRTLPAPSQPWSHIELNIVTGLPSSKGNTIVLTIIDRFSKMVHLIALPKPSTALETTDLLVEHIFWIYGIPSDIVADRGPQCIYQVCRSFCQALWSHSESIVWLPLTD